MVVNKTKFPIVKNPENNEIKAFQLVEVEIEYYGQKIFDRFDSKIMNDGSQFIIGGNGYIKDGTKI